MTTEDAEKFDRIRRNIQYGCTIKELAFLCRLVEKLDSVPHHRETRPADQQLSNGLDLASKEEIAVRKPVNRPGAGPRRIGRKARKAVNSR